LADQPNKAYDLCGSMAARPQSTDVGWFQWATSRLKNRQQTVLLAEQQPTDASVLRRALLPDELPY
jgi:hypothetical protein